MPPTPMPRGQDLSFQGARTIQVYNCTTSLHHDHDHKKSLDQVLLNGGCPTIKQNLIVDLLSSGSRLSGTEPDVRRVVLTAVPDVRRVVLTAVPEHLGTENVTNSSVSGLFPAAAGGSPVQLELPAFCVPRAENSSSAAIHVFVYQTQLSMSLYQTQLSMSFCSSNTAIHVFVYQGQLSMCLCINHSYPCLCIKHSYPCIKHSYPYVRVYLYIQTSIYVYIYIRLLLPSSWLLLVHRLTLVPPIPMSWGQDFSF